MEIIRTKGAKGAPHPDELGNLLEGVRRVFRAVKRAKRVLDSGGKTPFSSEVVEKLIQISMKERPEWARNPSEFQGQMDEMIEAVKDAVEEDDCAQELLRLLRGEAKPLPEYDVKSILDRVKKVVHPGNDCSDRELAMEHLGGMSFYRLSYCRKANTVPFDELSLFAKDYAVTLEYLLTGDDAPRHKKAVPIYRTRVSAGPGNFINTENVVAELGLDPVYIQRYVAEPENLIGCYVSGDSMTPTLGEMDMVLIDKSHNYLSADGIYCLNVANTAVIKRVLVNYREGAVIVRSDNDKYEDQVWPQDEWEQADVHFVGKVVWVGKRL